VVKVLYQRVTCSTEINWELENAAQMAERTENRDFKATAKKTSVHEVKRSSEVARAGLDLPKVSRMSRWKQPLSAAR